ncbi:MAG TPA: hypothetical protein VN841_29110 [Bryobacteraceae bacterium]|nr:hypothetical protein [Bryobacteraceae bacterium]
MFDALDTPGGHMVICLFLIALSALMLHFGLPDEGKALGAAATGTLFYAMTGRGGGPPGVPGIAGTALPLGTPPA